MTHPGSAPPLRTGRPDQPFSTRRATLIHAGLLVVFVTNAVYAAVANSGVCDELGAHIPAGTLYWTSGQWSGGLSNFPLGQLLITAAPYWLGHSYELYTEQHLLLFRLPVIFMGTLLGALVAALASRLYGQRAGVAAMFLYVLSPNVLAHSSLATLDLPTAFFVFLAITCLYSLVKRPNALRVIALAIAIGAALVVKVQAIALLGLAPLVLAAFWRQLWGADGRTSMLVSFALAPVVALAIINLVYLHVPDGLGSWESWLPEHFTAALRAKLLHGGRGHFSYLMGEYRTTGWWYYFPIAIVLKTPLPTLLLVVVGLFRRPSRDTAAFVIAPLVVFLSLGLFANVDIGLRHILIIYPFLLLLAARGATAMWSATWRQAVLAVMAVGYVAQAIFISPHHLSYFNLLAGGPERGHEYLIDSNFDWGQNDSFLRHHVAASETTYKINPDAFRPSTGHILINANALYGVLNGGAAAYRWLDDYQPIRQIAYTWFEFDIPEDAFEGGPATPPDRRPLLEHLFALQEQYRDVSGLGYRLMLAKTFSSLGAHDVALAEIRAVLAADPTSAPALAAGGELIVRHKLGVLLFEADEYLTGVHTPRPPEPNLIPLDRLGELARPFRAAPALSRLYSNLAAALAHQGRSEEVRGLLEGALEIDATNSVARKQLGRRR